MLGQSRPCKVTMQGYSRTGKFTNTFFHHPTRRVNTTTEYQLRNGNRPFTDNFRNKGRSTFNEYQNPSSGHRPPPPIGRNDQVYSNTQAKITVPPHSNARTDPLAMTYEPVKAPPTVRAPFATSSLYKAEVERQSYLPSDRQLARTRKNYHTQLGMQTQRSSKMRVRDGLNTSLQMQSSLQYWCHPANTTRGSLDDMRYASRK